MQARRQTISERNGSEAQNLMPCRLTQLRERKKGWAAQFAPPKIEKAQPRKAVPQKFPRALELLRSGRWLLLITLRLWRSALRRRGSGQVGPRWQGPYFHFASGFGASFYLNALGIDALGLGQVSHCVLGALQGHAR